jgi:hypothetical protein
MLCDNEFYLCPATVCACSRNPIGTAETACVVGNLVRGNSMNALLML